MTFELGPNDSYSATAPSQQIYTCHCSGCAQYLDLGEDLTFPDHETEDGQPCTNSGNPFRLPKEVFGP